VGCRAATTHNNYQIRIAAGAQCEEDGREENDTLGFASQVADNVLAVQGTICPDDEDWLQVQGDALSEIGLELRYDEGALELTLTVTDEHGMVLARGVPPAAGSDADLVASNVEFPGGLGKTSVFVQLVLVSGDGGAYTLDIDRGAGNPD